MRRTIANVVPRDGRVDITLPDGRVGGTVRDERGAAAANALVTLHMAHAETSAQLRTGDDGSFAFAGLQAGHYALRAESGERESEWLELELTTAQPLVRDLTLAAKIRITGRVTSDHGPLPNAQIDAFPMEHRYPSWPRRSDAEGRFTIKLPAWTRQVTLAVEAPGHALRLLHAAVDARTPLDIVMTQLGGRLSYALPKDADLRNVWLRHGNAAILAAFVPQNAFVEPGEYALCDASRCVNGTVAPGAELELMLP